ncbi:MAG: hypothetical protein GYB64_09630, partial [Chloroflexi bacterium]|nr:hypothetical protein [Chloroflexota bacterium]
VALDGGIGTLAEIALTWNLIQSEELEPRPFVLLSERWGPLLQEVYGEGIYIKPAHMDLWQTATTPEEAVRLVTAWAS